MQMHNSHFYKDAAPNGAQKCIENDALTAAFAIFV